jgi:drug/metabolite transporter (DMT)-like permease
MSSVILGIGAACGASSLYNVGLALQALDAREAPAAEGLRPTLLARLVRRRRWLLGTGLNLLGWPLQAGALLLAPLTVVQPALAFGLILLLVIGTRHLDEHVGAREALAVLAICAGVALLALVAPEASTRHASSGAVAAVLGGVAVVALAPFAARGMGGLMTLGAGAALAWSGLSTKLAADALQRGNAGTALLWVAATGLASGIGLLAEMSALQRRAATQVAPVVFVVQVIVPVVAAPLLVGERWHQPVAVVAGMLVIVGGALALLGSPAVRSLVTAGDEIGTDGVVPARSAERVDVASRREASVTDSARTAAAVPGPVPERVAGDRREAHASDCDHAT